MDLLLCINDSAHNIDASTLSSGKSSGMGQLLGGYIFHCSLGLCRKYVAGSSNWDKIKHLIAISYFFFLHITLLMYRLLRPNNRLLQQLGDHFPFELAVGMNGRVWVDTKPTSRSILLANAILASEHMTDTQIDALVQSLVSKV